MASWIMSDSPTNLDVVSALSHPFVECFVQFKGMYPTHHCHGYPDCHFSVPRLPLLATGVCKSAWGRRAVSSLVWSLPQTRGFPHLLCPIGRYKAVSHPQQYEVCQRPAVPQPVPMTCTTGWRYQHPHFKAHCNNNSGPLQQTCPTIHVFPR